MRKRLKSDQLDPTAQQSLEQVREGNKTIEALASPGKFHEEIHVAVGLGLATRHGAEERKAPHAELTDLRFGCAQKRDRPLSGHADAPMRSNLS